MFHAPASDLEQKGNRAKAGPLPQADRAHPSVLGILPVAVAGLRSPTLAMPQRHTLARLHRACGNQAVLRMLRTEALLPKSYIGQFSDPFEHAGSLTSTPQQLSRKCLDCEQEKKATEPKPAGATKPSVCEVPPIAQKVRRSPGKTHKSAARSFFEHRFDQDSSYVRGHMGEIGAAPGDKLGASANMAHPHIGLVAREPTGAIQRQDGANDNQGGDGSSSQPPGSTTITLPETTIVATPPAALRSQIGTLDYYKQRASDFVSRNPGQPPPDYYLFYGDKYVNRFKTALRPSLSPAGQAWVDCTLAALQTAIENRRDANPWGFAELELDNAAFRAFAFGTHPNAYVSCGVCDLSIIDETKISLTPDFRNLLTLGGVQQVVDTFLQCQVVWFYPAGPTP
jgi:hypothetical protein